MNKMLKNLIMLSVVICTISTVSLATNITNPNGKGTIIRGSGTEDDPYSLIMGEGLIDIYYEDSAKNIYFEFERGDYLAGNYIVEHNADKKRIRFTLISTEDLRVTSSKGINYLQAGAVTYSPNYLEDEDVEIRYEDDEDDKKMVVQTPIYTIEAIEEFDATMKTEGAGSEINIRLNHTTELENGYISSTENIIGANLSTYGTSYVFARSNRPYARMYKLTTEQLNKAKINYKTYSYANNEYAQAFYGTPVEDDVIYGESFNDGRSGDMYKNFGTVEVVYCFKGTSSEIADALNEKAGVLESIVSKVFMAVGDMFVTISGIGGFGGLDGVQYDEYCVTLDSLIFNEYPYTIVDFFGDTGYTNSKAKTVIEFWFDFFKSWAIIIYIIVLIYIGIKTVLYSGTSKQKNVKEMFEGWLQGLLLLFFMPFLFKHLIVINDTLVDIIRVNSKYSIYAYYTFENMYSTLGGKEDGEDSATTILERLKNAETVLAEEKEKLEKSRDKKKETLEATKKELEIILNENETSYFEKYQIQGSIDRVKKVLEEIILEEEIEISKNGQKMSVEDIEKELIEYVKNYFSNQEVRDKYISEGDFAKAQLNDMVFKDAMYEYAGGLTISSLQGNEVPMVSINENIYILGANIVGRDCFDLIYDINSKAYEDSLKAIKDTEKELEGINIAIEKVENNDADVMGEMRRRAGETSRIFYVVIWIILLFELVILLVLYYKRLFMLMLLITIFPLVTIAYVYEKTKGGKASILKTWVQEFIVNVFIQSIHAILYVTLVETGYTIFIANNDNWLIFFIAVLALIIIEPVVKSILGLKASTVSDLVKYGQKALAISAAGVAVAGTVSSTRKDLENIDKKGKNKEAKVERKNKIKDERRETLRQHRDNKINKDEKLTREERDEKLRKKHEKDAEKDKTLEDKRKKKERARARVRNAAKAARIAANTTSAFGAIAGALADGGDVNDFINASKIAKTVTGTGGKGVELTNDAQKKEEDKIKQESKLKEVKQENAPTPRDVGYNGPSYDDYGYGSGNSGRTNVVNGIGNNFSSEGSKPKINTKTQAEVAKRLRNARDVVRTNKTLDVTEDDENI